MLTSVSGSPFGSGSLPDAVSVDPTGKYAYVDNSGDGTVSDYTIAGNGALVAITGSPFGTGSYSRGVENDPSGRFAYVTNYGSNNVSGYSVDPSTGALTSLSGSPFGAGNGAFGIATCHVRKGKCLPPPL